MSSEKIVATIPKLKGTSNYEVWALRVKSYLIKEGLAISSNGDIQIHQETNNKALASLRLLIEDRPLLQICYLTTAIEV